MRYNPQVKDHGVTGFPQFADATDLIESWTLNVER